MTTLPNIAPKPPILSEHTGRRSPIVPAVVTLACAVILMFGSGFGAVSTCGNDNLKPVTVLFIWGSGIGVVLFGAAVLWLFFLLIWYVVKAFRGLLE